MLLTDPKQLEDHPPGPDPVVVIGAGAVGLHLATRLLNQGRHVVVLESGRETLKSFDKDAFQVIGREHGGIGIGRSVSLGGTSNLWGGQLVEFMPIDFERREATPQTSWPIAYEDVAQHYRETYLSLGVDEQYLQDEPIWSGIQKRPPEFRDGVEVFLTRWMKTPSLAQLHRKAIDEDERLTVVMGATAIGFDGDKDLLQGVRIVDSRGESHTIRGKEFVLAAGTFENVRLLLHTAANESWDCPWADNDQIGRRFQDHLGGRVARIIPRDKKAFFDLFCTVVYRGDKYQPKVRLRDEVVRSEQRLNCQGMIAFESSISENLVFLKQFVKAALYSRQIGSIPKFFQNLLACSRQMIPLMWKYVVEHRILIPSGSRIALEIQAEVEPLNESRITVDPSVRDRHGLPRVVLDWRLSTRELEDIQRFTNRVAEQLAEAGLADLEVETGLANLEIDFLDSLHDTNHQAGGCVLGASPEEGVVDADLRVFGTQNLYVAGACVFPTSSNANTTFTAMTLATRLAHHLAENADATG